MQNITKALQDLAKAVESNNTFIYKKSIFRGDKQKMKIEKGEHIYTITETANTWSVKTDISKLGVSYSVTM